MLRRFGLALLAIASLAGGARAQSVEVPKPYAIPLPPMSEPRWELGARFWASEGKTRFDFTSSKSNPASGNPTSVLSYDDMQAYSGEFTWYARNETNTFAKGFVGGGGLSGGSLDDEDFFAGQVKFSDTYSKLDGDDLIYGTIDLGQRFVLLDGRTKLSVSPLIGFNFWQETAVAYGARCNPDDVDGAFCGPPGTIEVPFSTKVIKNAVNWASLRLGGELRVKLWDRLSLIGDAAVLPVAYVWTYDSHFLRQGRNDLGPVPNGEDRGNGWGYQLEAEARYDFTPSWSAGAGVRYWHAEAGRGNTEFVNFGLKVPLNDYSSDRFGVFGDVTYRFATF
jgi:hypothetical protein